MLLAHMQGVALAALVRAHWCCSYVSPSWLETGTRSGPDLASLIDEQDPDVPDSIRFLARSPSIAAAVRNPHQTTKRR